MQKKYLVSLMLIAALLEGCAPAPNVQPTPTNVPFTQTSAPPVATKSLEDFRFKIGEPTVVAMTATAQTAVARGTPPVDCPVTPRGEVAFEAPNLSPSAPWGGYFWYGSDELWTVLETDGTWTGLPRNPEGYTQKIFWWSSSFVLKDELQPSLLVSGRRLDAEAPPLKTYGATNASAADIGDAMLTGVDFPTLGCWEITGRYKGAELTFVVWLAP